MCLLCPNEERYNFVVLTSCSTFPSFYTYDHVNIKSDTRVISPCQRACVFDSPNIFCYDTKKGGKGAKLAQSSDIFY